MRILLDKGFIRRMFEGFARKARRMPLTEEQKAVARLLRQYYGTAELYMSHKSFHTLAHRFGHLDIVQRVFAMINPARRDLRAFGELVLKSGSVDRAMASWLRPQGISKRLNPSAHTFTKQWRWGQR